MFGLPTCFPFELSTGNDSVRELSPPACLAFLCVFAPASVCTDVAGVDINLLDTVDVDVGNDIGGAGAMSVDIGGAGAVCVGVLVGVFLLLPRFVCLVVCLVDGSSSFRSGSCLA